MRAEDWNEGEDREGDGEGRGRGGVIKGGTQQAEGYAEVHLWTTGNTH